jgi:hypothetical protein
MPNPVTRDVYDLPLELGSDGTTLPRKHTAGGANATAAGARRTVWYDDAVTYDEPLPNAITSDEASAGRKASNKRGLQAPL